MFSTYTHSLFGDLDYDSMIREEVSKVRAPD